MGTAWITTKAQALEFVEQVGDCLLFPLKGQADLFSNVAGETIDERRTKAWGWSDELHLEKRLLLSLAVRRRVTLTSQTRFAEVYPERSREPLTDHEAALLALVREAGPLPTPEPYRATGLEQRLLDKALTGLRRKMLLAIAGNRHESATKHVYLYGLTERSVGTTQAASRR
ncbi:MAG: hypothetical protein NUW06_01865 [Candidatus Acetothermia bacterium]|nr:hypothetical protein [Candidatus Acetothermia bacterium]MDH7504682.1 hypothetical protein [Candidatus Acetothermia bacterium]